MSAKDTVKRNKTAIQTILSGDYRLILNKVYEKFLITDEDYNNLKSINREDVEGHVVELVDKIINKGEDTCRAFLNLLQTDEKIKTTFPQLKNTLFLPKPDQASLLQHDGSSQMQSTQACAGGSRSVIQRLSSTLEEELDSTEVAALCFLCRDVVSRSHLKGITNIKELFSRLMEKGVLQNNHFLSQILWTIDRIDLVRSLGIDSKRSKDTDESPVLSQYRVMLYKLYDAMINDNLAIMKFLLRSKLGKSKLDQCKTALDVFAEMEKKDLISDTNVSVLHEVLQKLDNQELAMIVENYIQGVPQQQQMLPPHRFFDKNESHLPLSVTETQFTCRGETIYTDARPQPTSFPDQSEYYTLTCKSHGLCVVINNEIFTGTNLKNRRGTQKDADALNTVFTRLGFKVLIHNNLTAAQMQNEIRMYSKRNFVNDNALVVCVLSHGEKGCVFGTDGEKVFLQDMMLPFTSGRTPTLAGKPKLFFIEASQGDGYQKGHCPCSLGPGEEEREKQFFLEGNSEADFLIGMATVKGFMSFRNSVTGCIYTQELCRQLTRSAESQEMDDLLTVLTRVNREVHKREFYQNYKQMPEARYTLTKKLVLKSVSPDCDQK